VQIIIRTVLFQPTVVTSSAYLARCFSVCLSVTVCDVGVLWRNA